MATLLEAYLPKAIGAVLESAASRGKRKAARRLLEAMGPMRRRVMQVLWEVVKDAATKDPDMMECVKMQIRSAIEGVAEDVEVQAAAHLELTWGEPGSLMPVGERQLLQEPPKPRRRARLLRPLLRFRAWVLYHASPYSRTLWGNLQDPVWWLLVLPTLITAYNIRCTALGILLLLLCFPGPPDEYQLTKYIVLLKINQFLTAGIGCMIVSSGQYYFCILFNHHDLLQCVSRSPWGPFDRWFCLLDYLGSFLLPQLALCGFHYSVRLRPQFLGDGVATCMPQTPSRLAAQNMPACCCCRGSHPAPRRLRILVRYDVACFVASFFMLVLLTFLARTSGVKSLVCEPSIDVECQADPALTLNAYWCKVFYALLTFPFLCAWVPDWTPVSFSIITRASRTGYNEEGVCMLFRMQRAPERLTDAGDSSSSESDEPAPSARSSEDAAPPAAGSQPAVMGYLGGLGVDWRYWCAGAA